MALVLLTFVLILGIILGAYYLFVEKAESDDRSKLLRRLRKPQAKSHLLEPGQLERRTDTLSHVHAVQAMLLRAKGLSSPIERLITQSGLSITVGAFVM